MSAETIATYGPFFIAAVILVPVILFLAAMLLEGKASARWGILRKATRKPFESTPLDLPLRRANNALQMSAGGLGFRRVSAAPEVHE